MTVTTASLNRQPALPRSPPGAIFIGVQINHPQLDITSIATTDFFVRDCLKVLMAALAVACGVP